MNFRRSKLRLQTIFLLYEWSDKLNCSHTWEAAWKHRTGGLILGKSALSQLLDAKLHRNTAYNCVKNVEQLGVELEQELIGKFLRLSFDIKHGNLVEAKLHGTEEVLVNFSTWNRLLKKLYFSKKKVKVFWFKINFHFGVLTRCNRYFLK